MAQAMQLLRLELILFGCTFFYEQYTRSWVEIGRSCPLLQNPGFFGEYCLDLSYG